ncbi:MAG: nickel pincer cofactor biosynthesis protein LarC [Clostridiales bacterium]|nr:nickel pincer cofactor biosynthesis protein LarC [Clostridiales bacterium]
MRQKLYLECYAGISGDMTVAALLDLGADEAKLREALDSLGLEGYSVEINRVKKSGLDVCDFAVKLDDAHENHDHDMAYLHGQSDSHLHTHTHEHGDGHGHEHPHDHDHEHEHIHDHSHEHEHSHEHDHHHGHTHSHRGLPEIIEILQRSAMTPRAKATALRIFDILAEAESKAHGVPREEVHFHEVGAVDSIVDIAAAAVCLDDLGVEDVIVPVLYEGCGSIRCQHGVIPVPVPATLNIVSEHHLPLHQTGTEGEFVTPTGAAIAAAIRTEDRLPETYHTERIGLGGGKRSYERPSILRAMLITADEAGNSCPEADGSQAGNGNRENADTIVKLECNVDDCSGEALGYTMERLFQAGARDVHYTPVFMKKNRPGYMITVICTPNRREIMEDILFAETTTIGIRRQTMERTVLARHNQTVETSLGKVDVKVTEYKGQTKYTPEYESAARIAREAQRPYADVYEQILSEIRTGK